ncbi:hypothetical protein BU17DRAFT_50197, partial [Hysterangium stoloniferum]
QAICQYFLNGSCRFGAACRNEHPQNGGRPTFGNQTWTPSTTTGPTTTTAGGTSKSSSLAFTAESIKKDLTENEDRPLWPLSSYGPGKGEPILISGIEESPEELRYMAWQAMKSGDMNQVEAYKTYEANKISAAQRTFQNGRDNSLDAFTVAFQASPHGSQAPTSALGNTQTPSAFGSVTKPTSAFGQPAFGQPSQPVSAFGRAGFGQPPAPVSAFGTSTSTSAFGQPSQPTSTFGQTSQPTSAFAAPAQPTSSFGSVTKPVSAFGQSAFGQPVKPASAFGQPAFGQSGFGQPVKPASAFGQPAFGQTSQPSAFSQPAQPSTSAFAPTAASSGGGFSAFAGKPASFAQPPATSSTFGTTAVAPQSAFGNPTAAPQSAFGAGGTGSAFGTTTSTPQSAFGTSGVPSTFGTGKTTAASAFGPGGTGSAFGPGGAGSAFGHSGTGPATITPNNPPTASAFGGPNQSVAGAQPQIQTETPAQPRLQSQLSSKPGSDHASFSFENSKDPYAVLLPPNYLDIIPKAAKDAFASQEFQWGHVPEWAPPMEMR